MPPDLFSKGAAWQELDRTEDSELKELAALLPTVVFSSRTPSTVKKYSSAFLRWKDWLTQKFEVDCCPASPIQVSLYLTYLITKSSTSSPIEEAVNAISWAHQITCADDPTQSDLVKQVLAGAKRILAHKTVKKEPITPEILSQLVDRFAGEKAELDDVWVITWCLRGFAGFLHYSELVALKESDIRIFPQHGNFY